MIKNAGNSLWKCNIFKNGFPETIIIENSEDHAEAAALAFFPPFFFFPPDFRRFPPLFFLETPRFLAFFGFTELAMDDLALPAALRAITTIRVSNELNDENHRVSTMNKLGFEKSQTLMYNIVEKAFRCTLNG